MRIAVRVLLLLITVFTARTQTLTNGQSWHYQLTDSAAIMDDCPTCDRLSFWEPLKGSFDLVGTTTAGAYAITNINFQTRRAPDRSVFGSGTLSYATGEPILTLDVSIFLFDAGEIIHMTNNPPESPRIFPMIGAQANEDPGSITRVYRLRIQAAPIREIWFSTATNFSSASLGEISQSDLLSDSGRIVKRNAELTEFLSLPEGDVGLDAVDVGPRGEVFFSITTNVESFVSGPISHGDVVTSSGRLYQQSFQLLSAFGVDDPEAGLDGLHFVSPDELYFSITRDIPRPGSTTLHRGDILSTEGRIVRTESALFLRWTSPTTSLGIDSFYMWPNGEIWFSPESDFTANDGTVISRGDLISDQGYIVYRNADLLSAFGPSEANANFGLDACTVISDAAAWTGSTQITEVAPGDAGVDIRWSTASARIFQLERASSVTGPWFPITGLTLEHSAHDSSVSSAAFYRLRQW